MIPRVGCCQTYLFLQVGFVFELLKHLRREFGALDQHQSKEGIIFRGVLPIPSRVVREELHLP